MAFDGYFSFAGTEIANSERTRAYVNSAMPGVFIEDTCAGECTCQSLPALLGDAPYTNPRLDDPPWADPDHPESLDFYGLYVTDVTGLTDDTVRFQRNESIGDGGWIDGKRRAMREVKIDGVLLAGTDEAAHYGQTWLKAVLDGGCYDSACGGSPDQLCFLTACVDPQGFSGTPVHYTNTGYSHTEANGAYWSGRSLHLPRTKAWTRLRLTDESTCGQVEWEFTLKIISGDVDLDFIHGDGWRESRYVVGGGEFIKIVSSSPELTISASPRGDLNDPSRGASWTSGVVPGAQWHPQRSGASWSTDGNSEQVLNAVVEFQSVKIVAMREGEPGECLESLLRYVRRTVRVEGPTFGTMRHFNSGGSSQNVSFMLMSESPYIYGREQEVISGPLPGLKPKSADIDVLSGPLVSNIGSCEPTEHTRKFLYDPRRPALVLPPLGAAPVDPLRSEVMSRPSTQYGVRIPEWMIPTWLSQVPVLSMTAGSEDVRFISVRFFPVPLDSTLMVDVDPCSACGEFEIGYIPAGTTFVVDATTERGMVRQGGWLDAPASHLLTGKDGQGRVSWPELTCGSSYLMVIDSHSQDIKDVSLSLAVRE